MIELETLLKQKSQKLHPWKEGQGKIPRHYKRLTMNKSVAGKYANMGQRLIKTYFGDDLFYTQGIIAGAVTSRDFKSITIVTPSQYGKSWLMARIGILCAFMGDPVFLAAANTQKTGIIMGHVRKALLNADPAISSALTAQSKDAIERLNTSVSKTRIGFFNGGYIEPVSLGDTFNDKGANQAIGKGGFYIVDEAALCSADSLAETGRSELADITGKEYPFVQISNPHKPGGFYDDLTEEEPDRRDLIIWMDALTAVEEGRYTEEKVLKSKFAKNRSACMRYWLCELDTTDDTMFSRIKTKDFEETPYTQYFMGIDPAYKGKDQLEVAVMAVNEDGKCHITSLTSIDCSNWVDGVTNKKISAQIATIYAANRCAMACVDIGYGIWLTLALEEMGLNVRSVNFGSSPTSWRKTRNDYSAVNAKNKRAELHLDLQDLLYNECITAEPSACGELNTILPNVSCTTTNNGTIQIMAKADLRRIIGHSPDALDAVLLAIHAGIIFNSGNYDFITESDIHDKI